jgi:hypothetical protein
MPPSAVKTVRDLIYWQYARIILLPAGQGLNPSGKTVKVYVI